MYSIIKDPPCLYTCPLMGHLYHNFTWRWDKYYTKLISQAHYSSQSPGQKCVELCLRSSYVFMAWFWGQGHALPLGLPINTNLSWYRIWVPLTRSLRISKSCGKTRQQDLHETDKGCRLKTHRKQWRRSSWRSWPWPWVWCPWNWPSGYHGPPAGAADDVTSGV